MFLIFQNIRITNCLLLFNCVNFLFYSYLNNSILFEIKLNNNNNKVNKTYNKNIQMDNKLKTKIRTQQKNETRDLENETNISKLYKNKESKLKLNEKTVV